MAVENQEDLEAWEWPLQVAYLFMPQLLHMTP
jgi:hypothetical protein